MIPVEGHKNLFRDERTGAILNTDDTSYQNYIKNANKRQKQKDEIEEIRKEIDEIKSLLKEMINGSK